MKKFNGVGCILGWAIKNGKKWKGERHV
jgi:hypothetical protein